MKGVASVSPPLIPPQQKDQLIRMFHETNKDQYEYIMVNSPSFVRGAVVVSLQVAETISRLIHSRQRGKR